ncbi:MAG TPA: RluA family pseudouridine synthase [Casimicrobiaceae bacterium]|nr:RluA family pseudouridine synthase [Casimicrobiaceae bacterium]
MRLDQALAQLLPQHSRMRLKSWIDDGLVTIDGEIVQPRHRVGEGEAVMLREATIVEALGDRPEALPLVVVDEDDAILVIDKPAGLVVHPGAGNRTGTLLNALLHHSPMLADVPRAGIVHRLDKDTSGLLVAAKTLEAHTDLVRQLAARSVLREYLALVRGDMTKSVIVDAPIGRHPQRRTSMAVVARGKPARTHVDVVARGGAATLVRCRLETGRTHQIRVHLASIGHALVGDPLYVGRSGRAPAALEDFPRQALHAQRLGLSHPTTRRKRSWTSPLPDDFAALLDAIDIDASAGSERR